MDSFPERKVARVLKGILITLRMSFLIATGWAPGPKVEGCDLGTGGVPWDTNAEKQERAEGCVRHLLSHTQWRDNLSLAVYLLY